MSFITHSTSYGSVGGGGERGGGRPSITVLFMAWLMNVALTLFCHNRTQLSEYRFKSWYS